VPQPNTFLCSAELAHRRRGRKPQNVGGCFGFNNFIGKSNRGEPIAASKKTQSGITIKTIIDVAVGSQTSL